MKDLIERFGFKIVQDSVTLIKYIKSREDLPDIEGYLTNLMDEYVKSLAAKRASEVNENSPKCPDCNAPLMGRAIKTIKYKSHWYCAAGECTYERYSKKDIVTELKEAGVIPKRVRR